MGTESKNDGMLYMDGMPLALGEVQLPEITVPEDAPETGTGMTLMCQPMEFSVKVKTPKRWRCRSRKRFIKLMMSEGIHRNYAERLAHFIRMLMPYGKAWRAYLLFAKQYRG